MRRGLPLWHHCELGENALFARARLGVWNPCHIRADGTLKNTCLQIFQALASLASYVVEIIELRQVRLVMPVMPVQCVPCGFLTEPHFHSRLTPSRLGPGAHCETRPCAACSQLFPGEEPVSTSRHIKSWGDDLALSCAVSMVIGSPKVVSIDITLDLARPPFLLVMIV